MPSNPFYAVHGHINAIRTPCVRSFLFFSFTLIYKKERLIRSRPEAHDTTISIYRQAHIWFLTITVPCRRWGINILLHTTHVKRTKLEYPFCVMSHTAAPAVRPMSFSINPLKCDYWIHTNIEPKNNILITHLIYTYSVNDIVGAPCHHRL